MNDGIYKINGPRRSGEKAKRRQIEVTNANAKQDVAERFMIFIRKSETWVAAEISWTVVICARRQLPPSEFLPKKLRVTNIVK